MKLRVSNRLMVQIVVKFGLESRFYMAQRKFVILLGKNLNENQVEICGHVNPRFSIQLHRKHVSSILAGMFQSKKVGTGSNSNLVRLGNPNNFRSSFFPNLASMLLAIKRCPFRRDICPKLQNLPTMTSHPPSKPNSHQNFLVMMWLWFGLCL